MRQDDPRLVAVRGWYEAVLPALPDMEPGDVIASLRPLVRPVAWPLDGPPTDEARRAQPARYLQDEEGAWWAVGAWRSPTPTGELSTVVLSITAGGASVQTADRATQDRDEALGMLPEGEDVAVQSIRAFVAETFPSGRREGASDRTGRPWRSRHAAPVVARALFCAALIGADVSHREAVRAWMHVEHDLRGPFADEELETSYELLEDYEHGEKDGWVGWRPYEDGVCASNRRVLRELPASLQPPWATASLYP